jgi:hypothetical protein
MRRHEVWLRRNINRGSVHHLINVILAIIKINEWKSTDTILVSCCCSSFTYQENSLFNNWKEKECQLMVDDEECDRENCPACS